LNQRQGEKGNRGEYSSKSWVASTNMTECTQKTGYLQSINSDKHLPRSPVAGKFFFDDDICIDFYELSFYVVVCPYSCTEAYSV
jgi:hypothetical protein